MNFFSFSHQIIITPIEKGIVCEIRNNNKAITETPTRPKKPSFKSILNENKRKTKPSSITTKQGTNGLQEKL